MNEENYEEESYEEEQGEGIAYLNVIQDFLYPDRYDTLISKDLRAGNLKEYELYAVQTLLSFVNFLQKNLDLNDKEVAFFVYEVLHDAKIIINLSVSRNAKLLEMLRTTIQKRIVEEEKSTKFEK